MFFCGHEGKLKTATTDSLLMLGPLDIVEGTELPPVTIKLEKGFGDDEKRDNESWIDRDREAMAIIRRTIKDAFKVDVEDCRSSKMIWDRMTKLHDLSAFEHRAEARRELLDHLPLDESDMKKHLDDFLRRLLKASCAGLQYTDKDKCLLFLGTLPATFDMFKLQWHTMAAVQKTFVELRCQDNLKGAQRVRTQARNIAAAMFATAPKISKTAKVSGKGKHFLAKKGVRTAQIERSAIFLRFAATNVKNLVITSKTALHVVQRLATWEGRRIVSPRLRHSSNLPAP